MTALQADYYVHWTLYALLEWILHIYTRTYIKIGQLMHQRGNPECQDGPWCPNIWPIGGGLGPLLKMSSGALQSDKTHIYLCWAVCWEICKFTVTVKIHIDIYWTLLHRGQSLRKKFSTAIHAYSHSFFILEKFLYICLHMLTKVQVWTRWPPSLCPWLLHRGLGGQ
jgi:hypothetical protein